MGRATIPLIRTSEVMVLTDLIAAHVGRETLDLVFSEHGFSRSVFSDPSTTVSYAEYVRFLEACARVAGRPLLGADKSKTRRIGEPVRLYLAAAKGNAQEDFPKLMRQGRRGGEYILGRNNASLP